MFCFPFNILTSELSSFNCDLTKLRVAKHCSENEATLSLSFFLFWTDAALTFCSPNLFSLLDSSAQTRVSNQFFILYVRSFQERPQFCSYSLLTQPCFYSPQKVFLNHFICVGRIIWVCGFTGEDNFLSKFKATKEKSLRIFIR